MRVRKSAPQDRDFVLSLAERFVEFSPPPWRERETIVGGTARQLAQAFDAQTSASEFLIAEDPNGAAGFAWVLLVRDFYTGTEIGKISEIATRPHSGGAGAALIAACENWVRERGAGLMTLNVMEGNERARAFYARHGYAPEYAMLAKRLNG